MFVLIECANGSRYRYNTVALHEGNGYMVILDAPVRDDEPEVRAMYDGIVASFAFER